MSIHSDASGFSRSLSTAEAEAYERMVDPNVYAVGHLQRSLGGTRGSREIYENEAVRILARLTRRIYGDKAFRRRKPGTRLIKNLVSIESNGGPHLNFMLHRPNRIDFPTFKQRLAEEWERSGWAQRSDRAFYCEEREAGSSLVGYCAKEGVDALLLKSLTW